jgi:hypothetical protein
MSFICSCLFLQKQKIALGHSLHYLHFQGYSKAQRMDYDEQGYRQYSHIVRVEASREIARENESNALQCQRKIRLFILP